jgi:hypothetical protein
MENRKEINTERKRRKTVSRPTLVRSEKPGQVESASYEKRGFTSMWKAA